MKDKIQLFENTRVRSAWDDETEKWYFSVVDIVAVLTESPDPNRYWSVLKSRINKESSQPTTLCSRLKMIANDGKKRLTDVATTEQVLRIIQSIPSPKAEPFKLWLAHVGAERIEEEIDPQKAIDRARQTYLDKGYPSDWVDQRIMGIRVRNELTDEWKIHGVKEGKEFSTLTAIVHKGTFGITPKEHKNQKGLKNQNLRDNMTTLETVLTMLGEATTAELTRSQNPNGLEENIPVAKQGGQIAGETRRHIEKLTGKPVVSPINATALKSGDDDRSMLATSLLPRTKEN